MSVLAAGAQAPPSRRSPLRATRVSPQAPALGVAAALPQRRLPALRIERVSAGKKACTSLKGIRVSVGKGALSARSHRPWMMPFPWPAGRVRDMVTRTVGLDVFPAAFEDLRTSSIQCKMLDDPWRTEDPPPACLSAGGTRDHQS